MQRKPISNEEKRLVYATLKAKLKVSIQQEFYLEALLLEYNILEDRLESILMHAGIRCTNSKGAPLGLKQKLDKIGNAIRSKCSPIDRKVSQELIDAIMAWKEMRNTLVHRSCQRLYNSNEARQCALDGNELVRRLTNAASAVKRAAEREK